VVGLGVNVGRAGRPGVLVGLGLDVGVGPGTLVGVGFAVGIGVGFAVGVGTGVEVGIGVGFAVGVGTGVEVGVGTGIAVGEATGEGWITRASATAVATMLSMSTVSSVVAAWQASSDIVRNAMNPITRTCEYRLLNMPGVYRSTKVAAKSRDLVPRLPASYSGNDYSHPLHLLPHIATVTDTLACEQWQQGRTVPLCTEHVSDPRT
jgi:hypothetical protein